MINNNTYKKLAKWSFFLFLLTVMHNRGFAQATVSSVSCSNNGTFENASDDFVLFQLNPDVTSAYSVTATFAGNPATITLMNGSPATNVFHETSTYFKIANGGLGAGNFTLTITPNSGSPKTATVANTSACSTVCTTSSTGNKVTYYYYAPYGHTELSGTDTMPKFDEGTTRKLTSAKVDYGIHFWGDFDLNNTSSGPVNFRYREFTNIGFSIAGNNFSFLDYELSKNPLHPAMNNYPVGFHSNPINKTFSNSVTYNTPAALSTFVGTGTITNSVSTETSYNTLGGGMNGILPTLRASNFYKVEYTYDCIVPPTVTDVACSNAGTFENSADDYVIFKLDANMASDYTITATFAGNPVAVTTMDDAPATNIFYSGPTYYKILNGGLGSGNFELTITPWSGPAKTLTFANPGTCSVPCTTSSTNNKITYYYYSPNVLTDLGNYQMPMPKFDPGTTRQVTQVKVNYGANYQSQIWIDNPQPVPVNSRYISESDFSLNFAGLINHSDTYTLFKNANYPGLNLIPVGGLELTNNSAGFSGSNTYTSASDISNFIGSGNISNFVNTITSNSTAGSAYVSGQSTTVSMFYTIEYTYDCIVPVTTCTTESSMLNTSAVTATANAGTGASSVIDNDLTAGNYWQTTGANNELTIDYGQNHVLNGFTYYPTTNGNTVLAYTVQTSTDGINFTTAASGSFPNYNTTTHRQEKGAPTSVRFSTPVNARYLKMIVAGSGKRVAEIIPIVCGLNPLDMTCAEVNKISSGTDAAGTGKKAVRNLDNNWTVTHFAGGTASPSTSTYNYGSIATALFSPAIVVGKAINTPPFVWATSPFGNAEWISATQNGQDINSQGLVTGADNTLPNTYFYKYKFDITDPLVLASLKLRLDYYVDNQIVRVYVNGVDQSIDSTDPEGYADGHGKSTLLDSDFQLGTNELVVQMFSTPGFAGLLVQGIPSCYCTKDPVRTSTGPDTNHGITLLKRAGAEDNDNWPMVRKSAHTVLESNSKGFVPTRMTTAALGNITTPVEGMMVFDTTAKCLKIYNGTAWKCFTTPACPQ